MGLDRAGVVARRVFWQLRRDRRTVVITLLQPMIAMGVFGYAFGGDVTDVHVAVANLDRGGIGDDLLSRLDPSVVVVVPHATEGSVEEAVRSQVVRMGVVIPLNFTRSILDAGSGGEDVEPARLIIYKDNANVFVTGPAQQEFFDALQDALEDEFGRSGSFELDERIVFGSEDERSIEFFVPGVAAYTIFFIGSMLTVVAVVKERSQGTLPRLLASPVRPWEMVGGYAVAYSALSVLQAVAILLFAGLVFGIPIRGNLVLALGITALIGMVAQGLGILVSGLAENEFQAVQSVILVAFPSLFLAGVFAPLEAMPEWMRPLSAFVPLTYAVRALRDVINYGYGLPQVASDVATLVGFVVLFLGVAAMTFGRRAGR